MKFYVLSLFTLVAAVALAAGKKNEPCSAYEFMRSALDFKDKIGMKPGDTMIELDGHVLTSPQDSMQAYNMMNLPGTHELTLERAGKKVKTKYEIVYAFKKIQ